MATGVPRAEDESGAVYVLPPGDPADPLGVRLSVLRLRAVPAGEPGLGRQLLTPRVPLPGLRRDGEAQRAGRGCPSALLGQQRSPPLTPGAEDLIPPLLRISWPCRPAKAPFPI